MVHEPITQFHMDSGVVLCQMDIGGCLFGNQICTLNRNYDAYSLVMFNKAYEYVLKDDTVLLDIVLLDNNDVQYNSDFNIVLLDFSIKSVIWFKLTQTGKVFAVLPAE